MKTKGRVLAAAVLTVAVVIMFIVGTAGASFAFGGWPYPGHYMSPELEKQQAVETAAAKTTAAKKAEGAVKEESGTQWSTEKAPETKPTSDAPSEK